MMVFLWIEVSRIVTVCGDVLLLPVMLVRLPGSPLMAAFKSLVRVAVVLPGLVVVSHRRTTVWLLLLSLHIFINGVLVDDFAALCVLHCDVPVVERLCLVRVLDCVVRFTTRLVEDVGESPRNLGVVVLNDVHVQDRSKL